MQKGKTIPITTSAALNQSQEYVNRHFIKTNTHQVTQSFWPILKQHAELCKENLENLLLCCAESEVAIMHHFGVRNNTMWTWRKALGVAAVNEGTSALLRRNVSGMSAGSRAFIAASLCTVSPERAEKIAAAKRGVKRSAETDEKMRQANLGRTPTDEAR
jgi:hypothetical protein